MEKSDAFIQGEKCPVVDEQEVTPRKTVNTEKKDEVVANLCITFAYSTWYDYLLMLLGVTGGIVTGASIPFFNVSIVF